MSTAQTNFRPRLPELITKLRAEPFGELVLIDVGASGGLDPHWVPLRGRLRAIGFDPLIAEIDRLNAAETDKRIRYEAAFVGCHAYNEVFPPTLRADLISSQSNQSFQRTSSVEALRLTAMDYTREMFNAGQPVIHTDRRIELDELVDDPAFAHVDFVKIDTDGHEIEVLLGARTLLSRAGVLGLSLEVQFHGAVHPYANTFANIDTLLRGLGFTLFDLDVYRYSRAALPARFVYDIPAQTVSGALQWGEAIYFRDLADADYVRKHEFELTSASILRLACLFEIFGLNDCAAEVLSRCPDAAGDRNNLDVFLDALTPDGSPYLPWVNRFHRDPKSFYRSAQ
jgi:FkbM family methyltransferase